MANAGFDVEDDGMPPVTEADACVAPPATTSISSMVRGRISSEVTGDKFVLAERMTASFPSLNLQDFCP